MGPYRARTRPVSVEKPYQFNNRFKLVYAKPPDRWNEQTMNVRFLPDEKCFSKEYRTVFGPQFGSHSTMPDCRNDGLRLAVTRLTCVREPETYGLHDELIINQYNIHRLIGEQISQWTWWFQGCLLEITAGCKDAAFERNRWCDATHPKRYLRQQARKQIVQYGKTSGTRLREVDYKCKTGELLADGKYPRAVGDMTCPGSTVLGYFMDWVKEAFSREYTHMGSTAQFVKTPDHNVLKDMFHKLIYPTYFHFFFFSDDSIAAVQTLDGPLRFNLDISSCDGSNFRPVFDILEQAMSVDSRYTQDVKWAFKQCSAPCVIKELGGVGKVKLKPVDHVLYSGSVLTTSINNMANTLIFLAISTRLGNRLLPSQEVRQIILDAGKSVGYILKIDECKHVEDLQFLKHSPSIVGQSIEPWLNIGAVLRGFGTTVRDLPGRRKLGLEKRARIFTSDVVKGLVHAGNTSILDSFNTKKLGASFGKRFQTSATWNPQNSSGVRIPDESIARRYGLSLEEMDELNSLIRTSGFGARVNSPIVNKIMSKDYSYKTNLPG